MKILYVEIAAAIGAETKIALLGSRPWEISDTVEGFRAQKDH
jgi:hypothetical protein